MMNAVLYERLVRPLMFSLPAETAHHAAMGALRLLGSTPATLRMLQSSGVSEKPVELFGLTFRNPVGLAAGFDKNAVALPAWEALGFGYVEIGTVTAKAQPGNSKPRIFRYPEHKAIINRLGFNNDGADTIAARLGKLRASGRWPRIPVGINLGKSKITPIAEAAEDYAYSLRRLRSFADYLVLNVSSPNTPGLRTLQDYAALNTLLRAAQRENVAGEKPLLVKIAPDISPEDLGQIVAACEANGVSGLIATNTTLDHTSVGERDQGGGLSGAPLAAKADEIIRAIVAQTALPVIGVGGIMSGADAHEKFRAGAKLVQVYTGFVYRGPALIREIVEALAN